MVGTSFAAGEPLARAGTTATVAVVNDPQSNVIAELDGRNDNNVVMAGAHLDSVPAGPGINDNGSGSAALLELAQQLAKHKPQNTLRFAWWGAEEEGLIGSTAYVDDLSQAERDRIALYMNYDMVGSPNYIHMVYDANQSTFPAPVAIPPGSTAIELTSTSRTTRSSASRTTTRSSRAGATTRRSSRTGSRPAVSSPAPRRRRRRSSRRSGAAPTGAQFDPCYHLACDTFANNNDHALDVNSDADRVRQLTFAYSTQSVNGVRAGCRIRLAHR